MPGRGVAPSGEHFDKIRPGLGLRPHGAPHLDLTIGLEAVEPQVSTRGRNATARGDDPRPNHGAAVYRCPHRKGNAVQRTTIPHRRYAGAQRGPEVFHGTDQFCLVRLLLMIVQNLRPGAKGHVSVHVDQPGQHGCLSAQIDLLGKASRAAHQFRLRSNGRYGVAFNNHVGVV